jgi:hypothetical protein
MNSLGNLRQGMPGHGPRVTEAKVHIFTTINICEMPTSSFI